MSSHTLLHTTIRLLAVLSIIHGAQSVQCYICESGEWKRNPDCESPSINTNKGKNCEKCYTIYRKDVVSASDTVLIRGCYSKGDSSLSKYNEKNYKIQQCSDYLCNGGTFNSHVLEEMQGMDVESNKELPEKVSKSCYKCSSYDGSECNDVIEEETLTATDCRNKLCTTVYSKKRKAVLRDCYTWEKVKHLVDKGLNDWTVVWCSENNCNKIAANKFPHCVERTLKNVVNHGCVEIDTLIQQRVVTQTTKVTTAATTTVAAAVGAKVAMTTNKTTKAVTTSEMTTTTKTTTKMTEEKDDDTASRFMVGSTVLICCILTKIFLW